VTSSNASGYGGTFTSSQFTTTPAGVTNITANTIATTSIALAFTPATGATSYVISTLPPTAAQTAYGSPYTYIGLSGGTNYLFTIVSSNASGFGGKASASSYYLTTPAAVTGITPGTITLSNITLNFTPATGATSYSIVSSPLTSTQLTTGSPYTFSNLTIGTDYIFTITSSNASGFGGSQPSATITTRSSLYDMTYPYAFITLGKTGAYGPTSLFSYPTIPGSGTPYALSLNNGVQIFTIPKTGIYTIIIGGSVGQYDRPGNQGYGIVVSNSYQFNMGQQLALVAGQKSTYTNSGGEGGGGGSFVALWTGSLTTALPIIVAGGGGGSGINGGSGGGNATATITDVRTGSVGQGGGLTSGALTNAGAGFYGNGASTDGISIAQSFINGAQGYTQGSFGGGGSGSSDTTGGGGGGGYSGGYGGSISARSSGGSSFDINGTSNNASVYANNGNSIYINFGIGNITAEGYNNGDGFILISSCTPSTPVTVPTQVSSITPGTVTSSNIVLNFATATGASCYTVVSSPATTTQTTAGSPYTFTGLTGGTTYAFTITPFNTAGTGPPITSSTVTTFTSAVTNISPATITPSNITLSFTPVTGATSYSIVSSPATTPQIAYSSPYTFSNLSGNRGYTFAITSSNAFGLGDTATSATYTTTPSAVINFNSPGVQYIATSNITLRFTDPGWDGVTAVSYYIVSYPLTTTQVTPYSPYTFSNLNPGTTYTFTLTSSNVSGFGGSIMSPSYTTLPIAVTGIYPTTITPSNVALSFTPATGATSYSIVSSPATTPQIAYSSPYTFSNLNGGTGYTFTMTSSNATGFGGSTPSSLITTTPLAVTGLTSNTITTSSVNIGFTPATGATSYIIRSTPLTSTQTATASPYTFSNLNAGSNYTITVTSSNVSGLGGSVTSSTFTTPASLYSITFPFTFTTAGAVGPYGPTLTQIQTAYSSYSWTQNTTNLNMTTQGYQLWTVPQTKTYNIIAAGAASGNGGNGIIVSTNYYLTSGTILAILVGQLGNYAGPGYNPTPGGGGGTYVVINPSSPVLIAGGGGAGAAYSYNNGTTSTSGQTTYNGFAGGTGGNGGAGGDTGGGAGGGGFNAVGGNGGDSRWIPGGPTLALSFLNGGVGGYFNSTGAYSTCGTYAGFGGGGGTCSGPGGGGGYSGGGGGTGTGGGGGGSYDINGLNNNATQYFGSLPSSITTALLGFNTGDGFVVIT
jgi:hypothetical protein